MATEDFAASVEYMIGELDAEKFEEFLDANDSLEFDDSFDSVSTST